MKKALFLFILCLFSKEVVSQEYDIYTIIISGEKERVKVFYSVSQAYLLDQMKKANFIPYASQGFNDPTGKTKGTTDGTWVLVSHPYSGYTQYIQMSNSLLRTMTDPTSNLSTAKAIYLLCNTQSSGLLSVLNRIPLKQQEIIQNNTCNHKEVCFCNQNQKNDLMDLEFIPKKHIKRFDKNEQILVELNDCDVVIQEYNDLADLLILSRKERIRIFRNDISNRDIKDKMTKLLFENKECLQDYGISRKQFFQTTGGQFVKWAGIGTAAFFLGKAIIGGSSNGGNIIPYQTPVKPF